MMVYINFVKYHFRVGTTVFLIDYFEIVSHVFCVTGDNDPCLTQSSSFLDRWERRIAHNYSYLHKTDHTRTLFVKWLWLISRTPHHNPSLYVKILTQKYFKIGQKIYRKRQNCYKMRKISWSNNFYENVQNMMTIYSALRSVSI